MTPASRRRYGPILSILVPPVLNIHITRLPGIKYAGQMNINPRWQVNRVDMHEFLCRPGETFRRRPGSSTREGKIFNPPFQNPPPWMIDQYILLIIVRILETSFRNFGGEILRGNGRCIYIFAKIYRSRCSSSYGRRNCFGDIFIGGGLSRQIFSIIQRYIFIRNEIRRWKISVNIKVPF